MKILYVIQGTGNGHLARATEIVPLLQKLGETDVMVSGKSGDLALPFPVKYRFTGLGFILGKNGGIDFFKTISQFRAFSFLRDIFRLPVKSYNVVISDFEPVSSWACILKGVRCIGLSHQNAVLHPDAPKPDKNSWFGKFILNHYAPSNPRYGFHFKQLDSMNFPPVIRSAIRMAEPKNDGHITVYLPAFSDRKIHDILSEFPYIRWEVFSKHTTRPYQKGNIFYQPVSLEKFNQSFIHCDGILCTAGFETPAEAIYMGKKICVVPMKNQYEQICNAAFLKQMGIIVLTELPERKNEIQRWLESDEILHIVYPDFSGEQLGMIITGNS